EKLSKIYLVINSSKGASEFSYSFKTTFLQALADYGVKSDYYVKGPLSLESEKEISERINKFNPQFIIVVTQTESKSFAGVNWASSNNINGGTFDIKILPPNSDKPVW